ncbi:MAG: NlpC/P60 family protein [Mycobacterium sp.]
MAGALVSQLTAPLLDLQAAVGSGMFNGDDPARMLRHAGQVLTDIADVGTAAALQMDAAWSGAAADAATRAITTALSGATMAASRASEMADRVGFAADAVARARAELQRIVDDFVATADALERDLPESADELVGEAQRALREAQAVVEELRAELDGHTAALAAAPPGPAPSAPTTTPAGLGAAPMSSPSGWGGMPAAGPPPSHMAPQADLAAAPLADPGVLGGGVAVALPDGSTVTAPNEVAASAVRHALTQLGVPYVWGGTTPGVGLDCSGLTQWAYHEAGLNLPRLAQEQDIGAAVDQGSLRPGDLAVWDGHVAMIVGNGMMVEAGDPVQLSPVRTTNAGQGFQGFWRPTA